MYECVCVCYLGINTRVCGVKLIAWIKSHEMQQEEDMHIHTTFLGDLLPKSYAFISHTLTIPHPPKYT